VTLRPGQLTLADLRAFAAGAHTGPLRLDSQDRTRMQATRDIIERAFATVLSPMA
jgi:hypothetical protein